MVANSKKLRNVLGIAGVCCATTIAISMGSTVAAHAEEQATPAAEFSKYVEDVTDNTVDAVSLTAGVESTLNVSDSETKVSVEKVIEESGDTNGADGETLIDRVEKSESVSGNDIDTEEQESSSLENNDEAEAAEVEEVAEVETEEDAVEIAIQDTEDAKAKADEEAKKEAEAKAEAERKAEEAAKAEAERAAEEEAAKAEEERVAAEEVAKAEAERAAAEEAAQAEAERAAAEQAAQAEAERIAAEEAAKAEAAAEAQAQQPANAAGLDNADFLALCKIVQAEAGTESYQGKIAVANVVLNRVANPNFPSDVESVITQPGQFSPVRNGRYAISTPSTETVDAVNAALSGTDYSGGALYFKRSASASWGNKVLLTCIGAHGFYR